MSMSPPVALHRKRLRGVVVSAGKMAKTVQVKVSREIWHSRVGKRVRRSRTYLVHDDAGNARVGDAVEILETRPLSRRKHFRIAAGQSPGVARRKTP